MACGSCPLPRWFFRVGPVRLFLTCTGGCGATGPGGAAPEWQPPQRRTGGAIGRNEQVER